MPRAETFVALQCLTCGSEWDPDKPATLCPSCGGLLDPLYDYESVKREVDAMLQRVDRSIWRWRELLPVRSNQPGVTLGEGGTPLLRSDRLAEYCGVEELYLKNDSANPTGSLKDRTIAIAATKALEFGYTTLACDSTGNKAASVAAYAARAGLCSIVLCPAATPIEKLVQAMSYGAKVVRVEGDYTSVNAFYKDLMRDESIPWYDCGTSNPFRYEGKKTYAYEIAERLEWSTPDHVLHPANGGMSIAKDYKGFLELRELGLTDRLPRMSVVQATDYAPIAIAAQHGKLDYEPVPGGHTIASALAGRDPGDLGRLALSAIHATRGTGVAVDDDEITNAVDALSREGLLTEPSGAVTIAGLRKLVGRGDVRPSDTVVCVLTGSGFKDFGWFRDRTHVPAIVACTKDAVIRAAKGKETLREDHRL